jgi:hypothetical protein
MFPDHSPCPCASGALVRDCLCKSRRFVPAPVDTVPAGETTGLAIPGCYAAATRNCKPPLTGEHPVSKTALAYLSRGNKLVGVSNHPWQKQREEIKSIGIQGLVSTVLCERHNGALSGLDAWVRTFVEAIDLWRIHLPSGRSGDFHRLFNGYDLERWMLKVLCGVYVGRSQPDELAKMWHPPLAWLDILFSGAPFPPGCGLYTLRKPPKRWNEERSIYVRPVLGKWRSFDRNGLPLISPESDRLLVGVEITLLGYHVALFMEPVHTDLMEPIHTIPAMRAMLYRPRLHRYRELVSPNRMSAIHLGWKESPPTFAAKTYAGHKTSERLDDTAVSCQQRIDAAAQREKRVRP